MSIIQLTGALFYRSNDALLGLSRTDPAGLVQAYELAFPSYGEVTEAETITLRSDSYSGAIQMSYVQDFYNRFHFTPQQIDFGVISGDTLRSVIVWNAYLVPVGLVDITPPAAANVDVFGGPSLPNTFGPLASATYVFVAALSGPTSFFAETTFEFDNGDFYSLTTSGDRGVITEKGPNWSVGVNEKLEFQTEIVSVSRSGVEQRRALRQEPRRNISYSVNIWDEDRLKIDGVLTKWRRRSQIVALSPYRCRLTSTTPAGTLTLLVDGNVPSWAAPGVTVKFAGKNVMAGVTAEIDSVGVGSITLTSVTTTELLAGTQIIWTMSARMRDGTRVDRMTDRKQSVQFSFDNIPGRDPAYVPAAAPRTFRGYELFLKKPNWKGGLDVEYLHPIDEVDFKRGAQSFYEPVDFSAFTVKVPFSGRRDTEIVEVTDFFRRQYGRLKEFYYPTWGPDILPKLQLDLDGVNIRVSGYELALAYQNQSTHKAVLVQLRDGTMIPAAVEDVYTVSDGIGDDSVIQVVDAWSADIPVASILKISWLMRCRLATDSIEVKWLTDEAATTQLTFQTLEHLL